MMKKLRVLILCGGRSAEHEVSLASAKNVISGLDKTKYEIVVIGIDKTGSWHLSNAQKLFTAGTIVSKSKQELITQKMTKIAPSQVLQSIDVVFPVLHGPYGEDGTIQGLLKLAGIPFVGASVLGSAIGMDKDVMKRLLRDAGIPIAQFLVFHKNDLINYNFIKKTLDTPFFIKPANLGSSVGISKITNLQDFKKAIKNAFQYDQKILIEKAIAGREIEVSVLGNKNPQASLPGEIIIKADFYDYNAKYDEESGTKLKIPANLPVHLISHFQRLAIKTFQVLCCEGMARVDFFLTPQNKIIVNEINTIPGFTKFSMYPKLWETSGLSLPKLLDRLIALAIESHKSHKND